MTLSPTRTPDLLLFKLYLKHFVNMVKAMVKINSFLFIFVMKSKPSADTSDFDSRQQTLPINNQHLVLEAVSRHFTRKASQIQTAISGTENYY